MDFLSSVGWKFEITEQQGHAPSKGAAGGSGLAASSSWQLVAASLQSPPPSSGGRPPPPVSATFSSSYKDSFPNLVSPILIISANSLCSSKVTLQVPRVRTSASFWEDTVQPNLPSDSQSRSPSHVRNAFSPHLNISKSLSTFRINSSHHVRH